MVGGLRTARCCLSSMATAGSKLDPSNDLSTLRTIKKPRRYMGTSAESERVDATRKWFETVVIGEKLCPFAPPLLQGDTLRIVASNATNTDEAVEEVALEANLLVGDGWDSTAQPETTLVVFDSPFITDFRDFVRLSWTLQSDAVLSNGHEEKVQLVLFHPRATHQTYSESDNGERAGDYSIRSPFPTVHLLREVDVMRAVSGGYPDLESLPTRNKTRLIAQGVDVCRVRLERCYSNFHRAR